MLSEISEQGQISLGVRLPEVRGEQFVLPVVAELTGGGGALADLHPHDPRAFLNGVTI